MQPTKVKRWVLAVLCAVLVLLLGPLVLFSASNIGTALLDMALNRQPSPTELVGSYKLVVPWGTSTLDIHSDGTFLQQIAVSNRASRDISGRWHASQDANFLAVEFRPFGMVWDDDHNRETSYYTIDFRKPRFGATYGLVNDDLGEAYKRR